MTVFLLPITGSLFRSRRLHLKGLASLLLLSATHVPLAMEKPAASLQELYSPVKIEAPRQALLDKIVTITQAEYDWPRHLRISLNQLVTSLPEGELKTQLIQLKPQLREPEDLLFIPPGKDRSLLYCEEIKQDHKVFNTFKTLMAHLYTIKPQLVEALQSEIDNLRSFYETFITNLCSLSTAEARACQIKQKENLLAPKALLTGELPFGYYRISQEMARQLISKDEYGFTQKKNETGMRAVESYDGVHFNVLDASLDDPRPGTEYMAYALAENLTSHPLITPSVLLRLDRVSLLEPTENFPLSLLAAKQEGRSLDEALAELHLADGGWEAHVKSHEHHFFVQASRTVGKHNLAKTLEQNRAFQADPVNLGWQFLFSLLTCPGDGKADNYAVEERQEGNLIIGIDNDKLFYPPLYRSKDSVTQQEHLYSGINCIFYLLDQLMAPDSPPLSQEVRQAFLSLHSPIVVAQWLGRLHQQNQRYQQLKEQGIFTGQDFEFLALPLQLAPGLAEEVSSHMSQIQALWRDYPAASAPYLLSRLYPTVADYYQKMRERYPLDPLAAMWVIYKGRDEKNAPQTVDQALSLPPDHEAWQRRVPGV